MFATAPPYYRVTGLLRANQLKWEERPLWYDVYAANPPLLETSWNSKYPKEDQPVKSIFYGEDSVRAYVLTRHLN